MLGKNIDSAGLVRNVLTTLSQPTWLALFASAQHILFPNSGSYRVLVGFQRTGESQESPQDFSTAGTGQAIAWKFPPEDEKVVTFIF